MIWSWLFAAFFRASPMLPNSAGATMAASVAMMAIVTSSSMSVKPSREATADGGKPLTKGRREPRSVLHDTEHLLDGGEPRFGLAPAIGAERNEPGARGQRAELRALSAGDDPVPQLV